MNLIIGLGRCRTVVVSSLVLAGLAAGTAHAAAEIWKFGDLKVYLDEQGFPRCMHHEKGAFPDAYITWDHQEKYQRDFYSAETVKVVENNSPRNRSPVTRNKAANCSRWRTEWRFQPETATRFSMDRVFNKLRLPVDNDLASRFAQLRSGATELRNFTEDQYIAQNPGPSTLDENRELTKKYGAGFALRVSRKKVESIAVNKEFYGKVANEVHNGSNVNLHELFKNYTILYMHGAFFEIRPPTDEVEEPLKTMLDLGLPVKVVEYPSLAGLEKNAAILRAAIKAELSQGKNVILSPISKSASETVLALNGMTFKAGEPSVKAVISLSGALAPSYVADWATRAPQWWVLPGKMMDMFGTVNRDVDFSGLEDLSYSKFAKLFKNIHIDPSVSNYRVNGYLTQNGLARPGTFVRDNLQDPIIRTEMKSMDFGAGDGFIEAPFTYWSKPIFAVEKELVMDGSHHLLDDGSFEGLRLDRAEDLRIFTQSLVLTVIRELEPQAAVDQPTAVSAQPSLGFNSLDVGQP